MKKLLLVQLIVLAVVILLGAVLKKELSVNALRLAHKGVGGLAALIGLTTLVMSFVRHAKGTTKLLAAIAALAIIAAGASGRAAVSGKSYTSSFNSMRLLAVVAFAASSAAYITYTPTKKPQTPEQKD